MKFWDKIKSSFKRSSKKVSEVTEEWVEKGQEAGGQGLDSAKEFLAEIGDKASEAASILKLKYDVGSLEKELDSESLTLGRMLLERYRSGKKELDDEPILIQLNKMIKLENQIQKNNETYDRFRKSLSDDYVVNKLSKELTASGAVIDQVQISGKSNVCDKLLKEVLLPKEALISAIKRGEEVIIPDGNTQLLEGDLVTVIGKEEDVAKVVKRLSAA